MNIETIHQTHTWSCIILFDLFANTDKAFQQTVQSIGRGSKDPLAHCVLCPTEALFL